MKEIKILTGLILMGLSGLMAWYISDIPDERLLYQVWFFLMAVGLFFGGIMAIIDVFMYGD